MTRKQIISLIIISITFLSFGSLVAQDINGLILQAEKEEKEFNETEALQKYLGVLKLDPDNLKALCRTSELYSLLGKRQPTKDSQKAYYQKAHQYATLALKVNSNSSEANVVAALSTGRIAQIASGEEKIKAVKNVKSYADKAIRLDPSGFKGYHVLAKWHFEVSDLNSLERWLVKTMYGNLPKASLDDAIRYYEKSRQLNPSFILNYLELAKSYKRKDDTEKVRSLLQQMAKLPPASSDDVKIKAMGKDMLDDL